MWNLPIFLDAWNRLLAEPFSLASIPITPEQKEKCKKSLELIRSCPVAADLDLKTLGGECKRLGVENLADHLIKPLRKVIDFAE